MYCMQGIWRYKTYNKVEKCLCELQSSLVGFLILFFLIKRAFGQEFTTKERDKHTQNILPHIKVMAANIH